MTAAAETALGSPYRGLAPFDESELAGRLFFGRERETEIVTANLIASRLTVLYGPSGVGKSSLVRAGVARRVRELGARRAVARGPDLACVVFASWAVDDPVRTLADAIAETVRPLVSPTAPEPPAGASLADVAEHWSSVLDGDLCLVLDQLEEYFVYHTGGPGSLLAELPEVVTRPALRASVLLSVRDDELARLGALKERLPGVFANARRLERLDRDAARAAVLGPLQRWNELHPAAEPVDIEPELVDAVLEQAGAGDGTHVEAPYLQLVMERIWHEEPARGSRAPSPLDADRARGRGGDRARTPRACARRTRRRAAGGGGADVRPSGDAVRDEGGPPRLGPHELRASRRRPRPRPAGCPGSRADPAAARRGRGRGAALRDLPRRARAADRRMGPAARARRRAPRLSPSATAGWWCSPRRR